MAQQEKFPLIWRIHNATCPAWLSGIGFLRKIEPGCQAMLRRQGQKS